MSTVLSIYNDWAFHEVVLPAQKNTEFSFLLNAERFHLQRNETITLSCEKGIWYFRCNKDGITVRSIDTDAYGDLALEKLQYQLIFQNGETLSVMVKEKDYPFHVYHKYALNLLDEITIGTASDNTICYSYPVSDGDLVSRHHCKIMVKNGGVLLDDLSTNGTYVNNVRTSKIRKLEFGDSIRIFQLNVIYLGNMLAIGEIDHMHTVLHPLSEEEMQSRANDGDVAGTSEKSLHLRSPRNLPKMESGEFTIDPPPNPVEASKQPLYMQIGPAFTMVIPMLLGSLVYIMAARANGGNSFMMYAGLVTAITAAIVGVFWAVTNVNYSRKTAREQENFRLIKYSKYLSDKQELIRAAYEQDAKALLDKYLPSSAIADYDESEISLWNRNFAHSDVLQYRLGLGNVAAPFTIAVPKEKFTLLDDAIAERPRAIAKLYGSLHDVPIAVDLLQHDLLGAVGEANGWALIVKNLLVQIAGNNSYADVKIAFAYDETTISNPGDWEFVKWLPHVWSSDRKIRYFARNKVEAGEIFHAISQELQRRSEEEHGLTKPYFILFVLSKELLDREPIYKYIDNGSSQLGLSTVIAAERYEQLPNRCEFIVENNSDFTGMYSAVDENTDRIPIAFDLTEQTDVDRFAKRLANIITDEEEASGEIPSGVSFFDLYGITKPEELRVSDRWRMAKTGETMKAPIGISGGGKICYLDIHERYHGPHGLVAGTTGSGKSETLQTYILSLAINFSPEDVGFFIIDYKGGGMANLFTDLPHTIGSISNLSGNQVKRAMISIKSENQRRQRIFSAYGVNNINSYTALYKNGDAPEPLPHLLIIVDEFAELKREEPEFMRELISVAQVGRSLGVHLILSTQKPSGTVDDNIWSNSKFKLCLRVQDKQDSMDMLHRPDAAYLTQAGRGFLQVGTDEIFEQFQSGYSAAPYEESAGSSKLVIAQILDSVGKVDLAGNHLKIRHQKETQEQWIRILLAAISVPSSDPQNQEFGASLSEVYAAIAEMGGDYKPSEYNSARLRDFMDLVSELSKEKTVSPQDILEEAAIRGLKLPEQKKKTQLEAVTEYLAKTAKENEYRHGATLWMPVLPSHLALSEIDGYEGITVGESGKSSNWTLSAVVGKGDDPENQQQMPITINFAEGGNHAICGTISSGKSTFLQTAVYSLLTKYSAEELNLYLIDFSAKLLTVFDGAKQVGGVMTDEEQDKEKIAKFFTMIRSIHAQRKKLLASINYRDYVEHSGKSLPAILIVIDNFGSFREKTGEKYEDLLRVLLKEGSGCGIYFMVSAAGFGMAEIPGRMADAFRTTVCLEMAEMFGYNDVLRTIRVPLIPEANVKGRGLAYYGERILEFQTALTHNADSIYEQNRQIKKSIEEINRRISGRAAKSIPVIPEKPIWEDYASKDDYAALLETGRFLPNGYDAETAAYSAIDLENILDYLITGTKKSGKTTYMKALIHSAVANKMDVTILEIGDSVFAKTAAELGCRYITDGDGLYDFVASKLLKEVSIRAEQKRVCLEQQLDDDEFFAAMEQYQKIAVFIPNMTTFLSELYNRQSQAFGAVNVLETLVGDKGWFYQFYFFGKISDTEADELMGYPFLQNWKDNTEVIRFGGKFSNLRHFTFANVKFSALDKAMPTGIGVVADEVENARLEQIVVPNCK